MKPNPLGITLLALAPLLLLSTGCQSAAPTAGNSDGTVSATSVHPQGAVRCGYLDHGVWVVRRPCLAGQVPGDPGPPGDVPQTSKLVYCPQGQVVTGLFGRAGDYIDRIGIVCAEVLADGTLGPPGSPMSVGGSGGGYFDDSDHSCPAGWAANGIYGNSGAYLDAIGLRCVPPPFDVPAATQPSKRAGGNGGHGYNIECATRQLGPRDLMTGLEVWSGDWINAVALDCGEPIWP